MLLKLQSVGYIETKANLEMGARGTGELGPFLNLSQMKGDENFPETEYAH